MERVFVIDAARTPIGKYGGKLANLLPENLGGILLRKLLQRNNINKVDEVIVGNVIGGGGNLGRRVALSSGLNIHVPALTIDRQCASGLESILVATAKIKSEMDECIACGGVESTSRAPWMIERPRKLYGHTPRILERSQLSIEEYGDPEMGEACEDLAMKFQISRSKQDHYAFQSQMKYQAAKTRGVFEKEIISLNQIHEDESPRPNTTEEKLNGLPPVFRKNGTLTAGNSSPLNDGAAFLLLASEKYCHLNQITPQFEILSGSSIGTAPEKFGLGPVYATDKLLAMNGLTINQIDRIELNEAFAAQVLACLEIRDWPQDKINISGGALAFGHPFGATGAILVRRLMTELQQDKKLKTGLVTMCVGGGQGTSLIIRKVD
ncbi:thiolase family protein [Candidatus Enterococcus courvalinii]|uniref:Acetoacetyl-CoA thiolase n=1 Tax=Candidatus Enterococcus courvalinii TaxID=2815329 RepID=A0ABS3HZ25_9ENTE|nr:thiolase family protein [Enterococcus sp. MSG2901]MBO0481108.1 thiolase family protein [Enterococcus sp. MSG2901]